MNNKNQNFDTKEKDAYFLRNMYVFIGLYIYSTVYTGHLVYIECRCNLHRNRNGSRPKWGFCNSASSLTGAAELPLQYNDCNTTLKYLWKKNLYPTFSVINAPDSVFELGISLCPMGDQLKSI